MSTPAKGYVTIKIISRGGWFYEEESININNI